MSIEVIGAGNGRTGTTSLQAALEILGCGPCYHMGDVVKNKDGDFWARVTNKEAYDFSEVFGPKNYKSSCDFPSGMFWKEQLERYPNAKVVLTVRDPEKWYKSCSDTVFYMMPGTPQSLLATTPIFWMTGMLKMMSQVIVRDFYHNDVSKSNAIKCFIEHNEKVIADCPPDKLLVFEVSQGWEPLCTFLGKPIPDVPFPNVNDTKTFKKNVNKMRVMGYVGVALMALPVLGLLWYGVKNVKHVEGLWISGGVSRQ